MKKIILFIITILFFNTGTAQADFIQIGGKGNDAIYDLAIDKNDNKYVTGYFQGKFNDLIAKGGTDAFVAKIDSKNKLLWCKQIGSDYRRKNEITEYGSYIVLDSKNNSYVLGLYYDKIGFTKKQDVSSKGKQDAFLAKYDSDGNEEWIKTFGTYNNESVKKLIVDDNDNIYVFLKLEFDNGIKSSKHIVSKFNSNGNLEWSKDIAIENSLKIEITKIEFFNDTFFVLATHKENKYISLYDANGSKKRTIKLPDENDIISFTMSENHIYTLEANKVVNEGFNTEFSIKKYTDNGEYLWSKIFDESTIFKPKNIDIINNELNVLGNYQDNSGFSENVEGSILFQFDFNGELLKKHIFNSKYQNRIFKYFIEDEVIHFVGQFYNTMDFNNTKLVSNGKNDSFIESKFINNDENEESINSKIIKIYPNPNNGKFYISNVNKVESIKIYDLNARLVFEKEIKGNSLVEVKNLESALYNIILYKKNGDHELVKLLITSD